VSRSRIIGKIENFEDAVKVETSVESGYHGVIDEHISYWIAVEEDVADSYSKIAERTDNAKVKSVLEKIVSDSRRHAQMLRDVLGTFEKIIKDEREHARLLGELAKETPKE
jgi:rubrerythrin